MRSRHFQRASLTLGAIFAAILFFSGGAALRLLMGPISLGPVAGAIEDSINRSLTGLVVRFDQAILEWSRSDGQINLIISGTNVFDATGRIVAQAPQSDLDFDVVSLLAGEFALKRFTLLNVQLTAVRDAQGALKLGFGQAESDVDLFDMIRDALEAGDAEGGSLETFSIEDARLAFHDEISGLFVVSPNANFSVTGAEGQFTASLDAAIELSGVPAQLSAVASVDDDGVPRGGSLNLLGLDFAALAANSERFSMLAPYALKTDISADYLLSPDGQLMETSFTFSGIGNMAPPALGRDIQVDMLELQGRYERQSNRVSLERARLESPSVATSLMGNFDFGWDVDRLVSLGVDIDVEHMRLDMPDIFAGPVELDAGNISAAYDGNARSVVWEQVSLESEFLQAEFEGTTAFPEDMTPAVFVTGSVGQLEAEELLSVWPTNLAGGARSWVADNVLAGTIGPIGLATKISAGMMSQDALPEEAIAVVFPLEGASVNYMTGLTPLTDIVGDAHLSGNTFQMNVSEAKIGLLSVLGGEITIPNLHIPQPSGDIRASASGSMADVLRLIDMAPLGYPTRFNVDPDEVDGEAVVDLDLTVPMRNDLDVDDVRIAITTNAVGLGVPLGGMRTLTNARAEVFIDNDHLEAEGTGSVNDVPMLFNWTEDFSPNGAYSSEVIVRGTLDEQGRENLRLVTPEWMSGPIGVSATFVGREFDFEGADVRADLSAVHTDIEFVNFVKEPGQPLTGTGSVEFLEGGATLVSNLNVEGSGFEVSGGFELDEAGRMVSARFPTVRHGPDGDFAVELTAPIGEIPIWRLRGRSLDARRLFEDDEEPEPSDSTAEIDDAIAPVVLDLALDAVSIRDEMELRDVTFRFAMEGDERLTDFYLDAMGPGEGTIEARFAEEDRIRSLTVTSDQAGDFVEAFAGFGSLRGGEISIEAQFRPDTPEEALIAGEDYGGTIRITNFTVVDQPFMARLFSVGSFDGPLRLLQNEGIPFAELEAPFMARGGQVNLEEGTASGVAMGMSFEGVIDRDSDTMNINGSLVPVFGLNNFLGGLPLVGDLLVSQEGEGIIGVTYRATGDLNDPEVLVNPLSVLTPGIFRRLFDFGGPPEEFGATTMAPAQSASDETLDIAPTQTE